MFAATIDRYFTLQQDIHDYFGYVEDWAAFPMDSAIDVEWMIVGGEGRGGRVAWGPKLNEATITAGAEIYSGSIYTQRFLPRWVYRGEAYTMILVDTHTDGNRRLMIFANDKEVTDENLKKLYDTTW